LKSPTSAEKAGYALVLFEADTGRGRAAARTRDPTDRRTTTSGRRYTRLDDVTRNCRRTQIRGNYAAAA